VSIALDVEGANAEGAGGGLDSRLTGGVRLSIGGALATSRRGEWRAGRRVRVTTTLRAPAVYLNPGVPDDRRSLARRGVVLVGSVKSAALVETIGRGTALEEAAGACRAWVRARLAEAVGVWSRRSGGVATAILIGDRTGLEEEDERRLQAAGTYHVIAISGGNIAILTMLLLALFRALAVPARLGAGATIALLLFYGSVAAPAASVSRAIAAAVIYLVGRLLDQRGAMLNVLAVAAILAVSVSPLTAFDPGFILSFGATLGILVLAGRLAAVAPFDGRALRAAAGLLAATIAAEVTLAPFGALFFSRVTAAGLLLNFAAIPLMTIVQSGSLGVLALAPLHERISLQCGYLVHLAATGLVESARFVEAAPWLARDVLPPAWWLLALYYASMAAALIFRRMRRIAMAICIGAAMCMVGGVMPASRDDLPRAPAGAMRVVFLDVGQGDATALLLPGGRSILVDAGGLSIPALQADDSGHRTRFDIGERVVARALRALGVRRLDTFVLTHADPDHIGGAPAVLRLFHPRSIWEGVPVPPHRGLTALTVIADGVAAEWRSVQAGDRSRIGPVQVSVLHPRPPEWERQRVRNEDSVVLEIRYGNVAIVLPGDIGREAEGALANLPSAPVVVLKAAHHGSATSTTPAFLNAVRPAAVVFSAGRANRFGHPAAPVVARVRRSGAEVFSTATDGAVILDTDGTVLHIRGWTGRSVTIRAPLRR
jgi:competence protein ComEC